MWRFSSPAATLETGLIEDSQRFLAGLNKQSENTFFDPHQPLYAGRAPGRLDLMGGIADYSGSLVLELPLASATWVAAQEIAEPQFEVLSLSDSGPLRGQLGLVELNSHRDYAQIQERFKAEPDSSWMAYPAGVWLILKEHFKLNIQKGVRLLIYSEVPPGKGVSSSAALEVATLQALLGLYGLEMSGQEIALLCQKAENLIVGAPCGIMDQMTSACGKAGQLLALLCQPAELQTPVNLPSELAVWGIDSGIRHAVTGSDYGLVRVGAFMGYRIVAELAGLKVSPGVKGNPRLEISDPEWKGYLANLSPSEWETHYQEQVPLSLTGQEFLDRWAGSTDPVTTIDPSRLYAVRQPTAHPIYENHRVQLFYALLKNKPGEEIFPLLGELMYQSHLSYSRCGLGSSGTDRLVELARQMGAARSIYGAKITGGGSGGTVAVLGRAEAIPAIREIVRRYQAETDYTPAILSGSSPGAVALGKLVLSSD